MDLLQECCTRSFFGAAALTQPSVSVFGRPVCMLCAQTCHAPQNIKPRNSMTPFVCECTAFPDHECIWAARSTVAADQLYGALESNARAALHQITAQAVDAQLARGKESMTQRINAHIRQMVEYENPDWLAKAREVVPIATLEQQARDAIASGASTCTFRDELMNQTLHWFKHAFFVWVNAPPCDTPGCGHGTNNIGGTHPNSTEAPFRPGIVELYKCPNGHITRFPRYNHALKLLETRRGRCGEYAQAFTLICRALGYEARSANDWTDHVWTEYFSVDQKRWIHADSCEARRDAPLLYEGGWGKQLNYIIACSKDEVVDVTKRYTRKWTEVSERRTICPEQWLQTYLVSLCEIKLAMLPADRQAELRARRQFEQAEFDASVAEEQKNKAAAAAAAADAAAAVTEAAPAVSASAPSSTLKEEEKQGRTTGSVEWRAARGELGADATAVERALHPELLDAPPKMASASTALSANSASASTVPVCAPVGKELCSTNSPTDQLAGLSLKDSSSPSPMPTTAAAALPDVTSASFSSAAAAPFTDAQKLATAKQRTAALFRAYVAQLTVGCGTSTCDNAHCKSNASFTPPAAANLNKLALELTKTGAQSLCPRRPAV